ncbi:MAG: M1 family peptidase [Caldilineae bacterium]|nr:MAG: M1 family peptidase [Caldilineae bacterium]
MHPATRIMKRCFLSCLLLLVLAACVAPPPVPPPSSPGDSVPPPSPPLIEPASTPAPLPPSGIFDIGWDDRAPFAAGLISQAQAVLDTRPGASVYHIDLTIADDLTHVRGREEVRYTNTEDVPLTEILLRLFPNIQGGESRVENLTVNQSPVIPRYELDNSAMVVPLSKALQPGEQVVLGMDFAVEVPTEPGGNYGIFASVDGVLALAHFYPMIAVYDDEGWNVEIPPDYGDLVYADTAYYLVRVKASADQVVVASGIEWERRQEDGRQIITVAAGPMRDFYLVSSHRYQSLEEQVDETRLHAYAPPELARENALVLRYARDALRSFNARFGPYPFTELDVAGTPTLAGGVEYPGLVVIALDIYDAGNRFFEAATAHEVAHQWFYSLVGNDQIDEPWLDESLAQYATLLYWLDTYGRAAYLGARQGMAARWARIDNADIPVGLPVAAYDVPTYSGIVYGRGALFFEKLAEEMGQDIFDAFLRDYVETFAWDIATTEGLKTLAESHCGCDLTPLFRDWIYAGD